MPSLCHFPCTSILNVIIGWQNTLTFTRQRFYALALAAGETIHIIIPAAMILLHNKRKPTHKTRKPYENITKRICKAMQKIHAAETTIAQAAAR